MDSYIIAMLMACPILIILGTIKYKRNYNKASESVILLWMTGVGCLCFVVFVYFHNPDWIFDNRQTNSYYEDKDSLVYNYVSADSVAVDDSDDEELDEDGLTEAEKASHAGWEEDEDESICYTGDGTDYFIEFHEDEGYIKVNGVKCEYSGSTKHGEKVYHDPVQSFNNMNVSYTVNNRSVTKTLQTYFPLTGNIQTKNTVLSIGSSSGSRSPDVNNNYSGDNSPASSTTNNYNNNNNHKDTRPTKKWRNVRKTVRCPLCNHSGRCRTCNGDGWYYGFSMEVLDCPNCDGYKTGRCSKCHGSGTIEKIEQVYE